MVWCDRKRGYCVWLDLSGAAYRLRWSSFFVAAGFVGDHLFIFVSLADCRFWSHKLRCRVVDILAALPSRDLCSRGRR